MKHDMIIIGAGISGLSMAHYCLKHGLKPLVLEKAQRSGGSLHSYRLTDENFWIELGAHSCFNSYSNLIGILEDLKSLDRLQKRQRVGFKLLVDHTLKSIPSQLHWLELLSSLPRLLRLKKTGRSVADYYAKVLGARNFEAVLAPAFDAVICQPSANFPAELLFRPKPRRKDVMRSFTFIHGVQTIIDLLAEQPGLKLLTGQDVQAIAFANNGFTVSADGSRCSAPMLCVATPADSAAGLLQASFPKLAESLARVHTVAVETLGVVISKDDLRLPPLGGVIAKDDCFFSVVSRDTVSHPLYRGFTFHFKPGVLDHAGKRERIQRVLGVQAAQLQEVTVKNNRLPALTVGHDRWVTELDQQLARLPLALTGNYFTGVSIEDCVERSLNEFSRLHNRYAMAASST